MFGIQRSTHLLKYQYNRNSWLVPFPKKIKNVFLNVPGRSVISSSSQMTSELYNGALKGSNHIEQQMLWNHYLESLPGPPIALWFPRSNLWPTLALHRLDYDYINPKDALTSPLLRFLWVLSPSRAHTHVTSHHHIYTPCSFIYCLMQDYFRNVLGPKWPVWYTLNFYLIHSFWAFLLLFHHKSSSSFHFGG